VVASEGQEGYSVEEVRATQQLGSTFTTSVFERPWLPHLNAIASPHANCLSYSTQEYDVLGLGQLMVDYAAAVDDDMLAALDVPKGGRRIVSAAEKASVMERLQGYNSQVGSFCRQAGCGSSAS
jgi:hypothetical protein